MGQNQPPSCFPKTCPQTTPHLPNWLRGLNFLFHTDRSFLTFNADFRRRRSRAREFRSAFGILGHKARREPVIVTKHGRDPLVVMAAEEWERLKWRHGAWALQPSCQRSGWEPSALPKGQRNLRTSVPSLSDRFGASLTCPRPHHPLELGLESRASGGARRGLEGPPLRHCRRAPERRKRRDAYAGAADNPWPAGPPCPRGRNSGQGQTPTPASRCPLWVVLSEWNEFVRPGPDLRRLPGAAGASLTYGMVPPDCS
jgi:hypothetical protein